MTRRFTLGCLLAGALMLGALPARAEYMRDEIATFNSATERSSARAASRSATRQRATRQRATRQASTPAERRARTTRSAQRTSRASGRTASSSFESLSGGSSQSGIASYYWQGQRVASGGWFNPNAMTAAHRTLPFGTRVRVTSHSTGRSVVVTINDRGPFIRGRIIDLSRGAAGVIGMTGAGLARVSIAVLGR